MHTKITHESINSVTLDNALVFPGILHNWLSKFKENESYEDLIFHSDQGAVSVFFISRKIEEEKDNSKHVKKRK